MQKNPLRQALVNGQIVTGAFTGFTTLGLVEILGYAGCDLVILDTEHGPLSMETLEALICAANAAGTVPVVRVRGPDPSMILQALDLGGLGVHVPRVNNREETQRAVQAARYYPLGQRGLHAAVRAARYGFTPPAEYLRWANEEPLVIIAIESVEGIKNLPEILTVSGIDVIFIGPADLSHSLGVPAQFNHPCLIEAMEEAISRTLDAGLVVGTFVITPEQAWRWMDKGVQLITFGITPVIARGTRDMVRAIQARGRM